MHIPQHNSIVDFSRIYEKVFCFEVPSIEKSFDRNLSQKYLKLCPGKKFSFLIIKILKLFYILNVSILLSKYKILLPMWLVVEINFWRLITIFAHKVEPLINKKVFKFQQLGMKLFSQGLFSNIYVINLYFKSFHRFLLNCHTNPSMEKRKL